MPSGLLATVIAVASGLFFGVNQMLPTFAGVMLTPVQRVVMIWPTKQVKKLLEKKPIKRSEESKFDTRKADLLIQKLIGL